MVVFSFAGQKIGIVFQSTWDRRAQMITITAFFFKLSEFGFYNVLLVILKTPRGQGKRERKKRIDQHMQAHSKNKESLLVKQIENL